MKFFLIVIFVLFNITGIAIADDAPFGLRWGMTETELKGKGVKLENPDRYSHFTFFRTESLPQNISIAEGYSIGFSNKYGLQKVTMISNTITDDIYGSEGKELYQNIKDALIKKYGTPSDAFERVGSKLYDESDEFYQCLDYSGCGMWASIFKKDGMVIVLELDGLGRGKGYLRLLYEGPKWSVTVDEYEQEKTKSDSGAL